MLLMRDEQDHCETFKARTDFEVWLFCTKRRDVSDALFYSLLFSGLNQAGYLIEASLNVEESFLNRGDQLMYSYVVMQRNKEISETATRFLAIPWNPDIKGKTETRCDRLSCFVLSLFTNLMFYPELHLYEGFISRLDKSILKSGLHMVGLSRSNGVEISDAWQTAATVLLNRIFQKWTPSDKQSTESLCHNLRNFTQSLSSAPHRMAYSDRSHPPMVKVGSVRNGIIKPPKVPPVINVCTCRHRS